MTSNIPVEWQNRTEYYPNSLLATLLYLSLNSLVRRLLIKLLYLRIIIQVSMSHPFRIAILQTLRIILQKPICFHHLLNAFVPSYNINILTSLFNYLNRPLSYSLSSNLPSTHSNSPTQRLLNMCSFYSATTYLSSPAYCYMKTNYIFLMILI